MHYWCNLFWPDLPNVILQRSSGLNRQCNLLAALKLTITILPVHLKMYLMVFFVFSSKKCFSVNGEMSPKISYFVKKISHVRHSYGAHDEGIWISNLHIFEGMNQDCRAQMLLKSYVTFYTWLLNSVWGKKTTKISKHTHFGREFSQWAINTLLILISPWNDQCANIVPSHE